MVFLHKFSLGSEQEKASLIYHDLFGFPLTGGEMFRWTPGKKTLKQVAKLPEVEEKEGFYFLKGKEGIVYKRALRERISERKRRIAERAASLLKKIPTLKMLAITGALAMGNASEESDIDFLVITKKNTLWTTRLFVYLFICLFGIKTRRPKDKQQRDKLCLNLWLDEKALFWNPKDRNLYTAHEIAQIVPLVNKDKTYEKFLAKNRWILDYWPNSVKILALPAGGQKSKFKSQIYNLQFKIFEKLAYKMQYLYMKPKITREIITPHKAIFHPQDWGEVVLDRLKMSL